jgi:cysteinyl-tRNA synthetase
MSSQTPPVVVVGGGGIMSMYNSLTQQMERLPTASAAAAAAAVDDQGNNKKSKGIACYTCGPTTYAPAHLGHARTYVQLDIFRRVLEYASRIQQQQQHPDQQPQHLPLFVMNITDVDDKIILAAAAAVAAAENQQLSSPLELARRYEAAFWNDMDALNCLRPHVVTRVTEHVESDIIPYIQQLVHLKMAYIVPEDDDDVDDDGNGSAACAVYFDVRAFEEKMHHRTRYGKLAPLSASTDFFNRVEPNSSGSSSETESLVPSDINEQTRQINAKRDDRDFALWKPRKRGECMYWNSPSWGNGRPGWHIECSAMIQAVQQRFIDTHVFAIHAGGVDLKFPHHTNEIAQAEAYHSSRSSSCSGGCSGEWIPHWIHTGHLHIDGQKMSKSLKNFITIEELLTDPEFTGGVESSTSSSSSSTSFSPLSSPAEDFRLWCLGLSGSYRGPATFSRERILEARAVRQKLVRFLLEGYEWIAKHSKENVIMNDSPKKWQECDYHLFQTTSTVSANAMQALLYSDLDGSTFVKQVVHLAEVGTAHLHSVPPGQGPVEAVYAAMDTVQTLLALVGFTDATTCRSRATNGNTNNNNNNNNGVVVGGERALLDEFVEFRNAVRQIALREEKNDAAALKLKKIMELCDAARDCTFPGLGVELLDAKVNEDSNPSSTLYSSSSSSSSSSWRYCLPRTSLLKQQEQKSDISISATTRESATTKAMPQRQRTDPIPVHDLFRLGKQYAGQFSSFDEHTGFPTRLADGSDISNRLRKKLDKKRAAYSKRIQEEQETGEEEKEAK